MGLPTPPTGDMSFIEWVLGAVGAAATAALAIVWRGAAKAARMMSDIDMLKDWRREFEKRVADDRAENQRRHEDNLKALGKIPDIDDFRRLEDRMNDNFRELKESLALRPRRRGESGAAD